MRAIRFRAKDLGTGEWCYGYYCEQHMPEYDNDIPNRVIGYTTLSVLFNDEPRQRRGDCSWTEVKRGTVGQFTGLTDKNGYDIYEGDIVKRTSDINGYCPITGVVRYSEESAQFVLTDEYGNGHPFISKERNSDGDVKFNVRYSYTILGNIYDNTELWPTIKD